MTEDAHQAEFRTPSAAGQPDPDSAASAAWSLPRALRWIVPGTGALLLIPAIAMLFTSEVNWDLFDFVVMGAMLIVTASLFVLAARRAPPRRRLIMGGLFLAAFLYVWAELAVGVFTNLGS